MKHVKKIELNYGIDVKATHGQQDEVQKSEEVNSVCVIKSHIRINQGQRAK
jgi:hypothetical protein